MPHNKRKLNLWFFVDAILPRAYRKGVLPPALHICSENFANPKLPSVISYIWLMPKMGTKLSLVPYGLKEQINNTKIRP